MKLASPALTVLLLSAVLAGPASAQSSGNFVVRLGTDTTGVEHYTHTAKGLEIHQVGRAPRVYTRHLVFDLTPGGMTTRTALTISAPGAPAGARPVQQVDATMDGDSLRVATRRDTSVQRIAVAAPGGAVIVVGSSPWAEYEVQTMRLAGQKGDSLRSPLYYLGAGNMSWMVVRRLGADSMVIQTEHDLYHARVDKKGVIQSVVPIIGTAKFSVDRVADLDLAAMTASFAVREQQGGAMGALSTRDTVRTQAGGAELWIDYGRPSKRGRVIFGAVVPWGIVWRTGANAATQFKTDKALAIGNVTVPAGFYTLWTLPSPDGWKLIINSETGQWGTDHKAEKDLFTVAIPVTKLADPVERFTIMVAPSEQGGVINLDWDDTRVMVPFTVKP
jgi:Protein of unknown function (DUF2911)